MPSQRVFALPSLSCSDSQISAKVRLTSAQNLVPEPMRGRYFAIDGLLSFIGGPLSVAAGGILITLIGVVHVFELGGVLILAFAAVSALMGSLWMLDGRLKHDN